MKKNKIEVSKEFVAEIERMSKEQVYDLLLEKIAMINESEDLNDKEARVMLDAEIKKLCVKYNELSMLTVYGICAKAQYPVLELAQTFYYPSVKTTTELGEEIGEDGKKHTFPVLKIAEGKTRLDLFDFLQWAERLNKQVTSQKNWRTPCRTTRNSIVNEWKKVLENNSDKSQINKKLLQETLQEMYDALLFIPSPNNNNRVMATKKVAAMLFGFSNVVNDKVNEDGEPVINFTVLPDKQWIKLVMYALHKTVKDKDYAPNDLEIKYCVEEEEVQVTESEAEAESK